MLKTARFVFDGWTGEYKNRYKGSFSLFEREIRHLDECPDVLRWVPTIWPEETEDEGAETKSGTMLLANYYHEDVKPEDIEKFLTNSGIKFHRADPFLVKTKNAFNVSVPTDF